MDLVFGSIIIVKKSTVTIGYISQIVYRIFDSDKNGSISRLELLSIVKHLFHLVPDTEKEDLPTPQKVRFKNRTPLQLLQFHFANEPKCK